MKTFLVTDGYFVSPSNFVVVLIVSMSQDFVSSNSVCNHRHALFRRLELTGLDWTSKTWTCKKRGLGKRGLVKRGLEKRVLLVSVLQVCVLQYAVIILVTEQIGLPLRGPVRFC